eukprot:TRINITY_DN20917_c0_g1_i2.p2 TRINITY_DN20917_c0_g1~~TRINITY_DN20917_c0_g1_i2.p2  ORF type:complete len:134 (+),score=19.95 TRINITY_DN20917_c0_g1_i2:96-497(+)
MTQSATLHRPVAIARVLDIFSDAWSFAVLQEAFFGVRRFDDFQQNLSISRSVLTQRLKHLVNQKILERRRYSTRPARYEYRLTERGRWLDKVDSVPELRLIHTPCNHTLDMRFSCAHCGSDVMATEVHYELPS